jgi:putative nicotinate phosphoribosyltransferase
MGNSALFTDKYELTMLDALVREGRHKAPATFEVFARRLQPGFRYGVFAGLGRLLPMIKDFYFDAATLDTLFPMAKEELSEETFHYLCEFVFKGTIESYTEGNLYFPHSPVMQVSGELGQCLLLETLILSVLNHDSAIASKAARIRSVADGRTLIEMGSRRTHEEAAVAAARAAYIAGFDATSNLAAEARHQIPATGTAAHAFTLAHLSEADAFASQVEAQGVGTTFLVDTYDVAKGILTAIEACRATDINASPGAVRIDSGDLSSNAKMARELLDQFGCYSTQIVVTSDLDEYVIKDLRDAPIDAYGVGTQLVSTAPAGMVYKLVEIDGRPVAKKSKDKASVGGRKQSWREFTDGRISGEKFTTSKEPVVRTLQETVMHGGEITTTLDVTAARHEFAHRFSYLPVAEQTVWNGDFGPFITCEEEK